MFHGGLLYFESWVFLKKKCSVTQIKIISHFQEVQHETLKKEGKK